MQLTVAIPVAADDGPSTFLDTAQDRLHAQVEAALEPLHVGPERSERVRRALRDLDLAWPDPIRDEQYGCPLHGSWSIGGFELFVDDDGRPRCVGSCPAGRVLAALSIPVEEVRTDPGPSAAPRKASPLGWRAQVPPAARRAA